MRKGIKDAWGILFECLCLCVEDGCSYSWLSLCSVNCWLLSRFFYSLLCLCFFFLCNSLLSLYILCCWLFLSHHHPPLPLHSFKPPTNTQIKGMMQTPLAFSHGWSFLRESVCQRPQKEKKKQLNCFTASTKQKKTTRVFNNMQNKH